MTSELDHHLKQIQKRWDLKTKGGHLNIPEPKHSKHVSGILQT